MFQYMYYVKKRLVWVVFRIEAIRDKDNETWFEIREEAEKCQSTVLPFTITIITILL